uniref:Di-N-acetylchitobiase n=2 Tax=Oncorhynchus tshawytscha TaxID=74940 RepID=A0A8C8MIN3_ONCTS
MTQTKRRCLTLSSCDTRYITLSNVRPPVEEVLTRKLRISNPTNYFVRNHTQLLSIMWLFLFLTLVSVCCKAEVCPCEIQELCQQIRDEKDFEVFVFDVGKKAWKSYDWGKVTTVAAFGKYDAELMCHAHSKGARLVLKGDVSIPEMVDPANRTAWIISKVDLAKRQFMDGINIDIEQEVADSSPEYYTLTALVKETTEAFHREIPGSQVSFDVAWSPKCIDGRCYDYTAIAESCDLLFVMSYDEQSQIWGDCVAMANAPFNQTQSAYDQYLAMKIDPKKLVMGVPWYGYDYPCLDFSQEGVCSLAKVPFRGAPCSDAAGRQIPYSFMMKQINGSMSGRLWDEVQLAPYYNYKDQRGQIHQVWYDDPESIALKVAYVRELGLKGAGMWCGNLLDYSNDSVAQEQSRDMWNALMGCQDAQC